MANVIQSINGMLGWLDIHDRILGLNDNAVRLLGFESLEKAIGKTPYDLNCPAVECVEQFIEQDHYVINTKEPLQILDIHPYADGSRRIWLTTKTPLIADDHVLGTVYHCQPLQQEVIFRISQILFNQDSYYTKSKQRSYNIEGKLKDKHLSARQQECLYHLLRGKSAGTIAEILKLSKRTIESYIEEIKYKMHCASKAELIEKSIDEGLLFCIPKDILSGNISLMLTERVAALKKIVQDSLNAN
jgi:DNA-binding CsgD family transcriptional regulator